MSDVAYRPTEGATEGGAPLAKPDVPVSESQREPRVTLAERIERSKPVRINEIRSKTRRRQDEAPTVELDFKENARSDGSMDLRTAARALSAEHAKAHGDTLAGYMGVDPDQLSDEARQRLGEDLSAAGRKPGEERRVKLGIADHEYNPAKPFLEKEGGPLKQMRDRGESPLTLSEAARGMTRFRELQNAQEQLSQQQLRDEVRGQLQAGATPEELVDPNFQGVQQSEQAVQSGQAPQVEPRTEPQRPQADPNAAERARLQAEYNRAAAYREHAQYTAAERQLEEGVNKLDRWAQSQPELMDHNLFQNLVYRAQRGDIASANKLKQFQKAFDTKKAYVQRFVEVNTARVNRQIALEQHQAQQNAQAAEAQRAQHNKQFDEWLEKEHPHFAKGENNKALKRAAKAILKERGMSDAQIAQLRPTALEQSVLAESAMMRVNREYAKEVQARGLPTVQQYQAMKPGGVTVGPRGGGDVDDIKKLQGRVSGARSERQALMAATELMRAKRRA